MTTPKAEPIDWQARCLLAERARDKLQAHLETLSASYQQYIEGVRSVKDDILRKATALQAK